MYCEICQVIQAYASILMSITAYSSYFCLAISFLDMVVGSTHYIILTLCWCSVHACPYLFVFSSLVLRKNAWRLHLELVCPEACNFLCTIMYNNPKNKDRTLWKIWGICWCTLPWFTDIQERVHGSPYFLEYTSQLDHFKFK